MIKLTRYHLIYISGTAGMSIYISCGGGRQKPWFQNFGCMPDTKNKKDQ